MMSLRTKDALHQLAKLIEADPKVKQAFEVLQAAVTDEVSRLLGDVSRQQHQLSRRGETAFVNSVGGRRVLERAMKANPRATEQDLIAAGERQIAAVLGDWWIAEMHRARQEPGCVLG